MIYRFNYRLKGTSNFNFFYFDFLQSRSPFKTPSKINTNL
jgi:hypothetical protein